MASNRGSWGGSRSRALAEGRSTSACWFELAIEPASRFELTRGGQIPVEPASRFELKLRSASKERRTGKGGDRVRIHYPNQRL